MDKELSDKLKGRMGYRERETRRCDGCKYFKLVGGFLDRTWEGRCEYWKPKLEEMSVLEDALCDRWEAKNANEV